MGKLGEDTSMAADESQKQKWGDRWSKAWWQNRTLCVVDGPLSSKEFGPDMWKHMSDAAKRKEKQKWAIEKSRLDQARRSRSIFFIDPDDEGFKRTVTNACKKLEIPMPAAMPCRLQRCPYRENLQHCWRTQDKICLYCWSRRIYEDTHGGISSQESWRAHCGKRDEFIESLQFCAQIDSNASSYENTRCKGSSGEKMEKLEKNTSIAIDESQKQKWGDRWSKEWKQNRTFCVVNGSLSS